MQTAHSNLCRGARTNKMIPTQKWWTEFLNPFSERFLLTTTQKNCEQLFNSTVLSLSAYRFWVIHDRPIHSEKETFQDQRGTLTDDGSFFFFFVTVKHFPFTSNLPIWSIGRERKSAGKALESSGELHFIFRTRFFPKRTTKNEEDLFCIIGILFDRWIQFPCWLHIPKFQSFFLSITAKDRHLFVQSDASSLPHASFRNDVSEFFYGVVVSLSMVERCTLQTPVREEAGSGFTLYTHECRNCYWISWRFSSSFCVAFKIRVIGYSLGVNKYWCMQWNRFDRVNMEHPNLAVSFFISLAVK